MTAFVLDYEEVTGGASTAMLKPTDLVAVITKYAEAENIDLSALSAAQVEALVTKFSEAANCDKSELLKAFTAYITEYKEAEGVKKPKLNIQVGLTGYDLLAYRQWLKNNKVEVEGIVRLSEAYEDPASALGESGVKYWKDGQELPVTAVTQDMLKPDDVAVLDADGTMHILLTADVTGSQEAIEKMRSQVAEADQLGMTKLGTALTGIMPMSLIDMIDAARERIQTAKGSMDKWWNFIYGGNEGVLNTLDQSMQMDFSPDRAAELSTYVSELVSAIKQGEAISPEDLDNLTLIKTFVDELDAVGVGGNVTEGIAQGMAEAGWDTSAETVASNLEEAINNALVIHSPSERMKPTGENIAAGISEGMIAYDIAGDVAGLVSAMEGAFGTAFTAEWLQPFGTAAMAGLGNALTGYDTAGAARDVSAKLKSALSAALNGTSLRSIGVSAMAGLKAGILAGRSSVISAMRSAARSAVSAAKAELQIASPSKVFRDEVGTMTMKGFAEGVLRESRAQARTIRNAARFLTGEAKEGAVAFGHTDNRRTYNSTSSVSLSGNNFYVRDETDIRSLAIEIAALTRRQQRGRGLKMA